MLFYSHSITPRLQYIVSFLSHYYHHPFGLTTDKEGFISAPEPKMAYSSARVTREEIWINTTPLLFQKDILSIEVTCFHHPNNYNAFFKTDDDVGFDIVAAIFYLLSRYEEYGPHQKDEYGRYAHTNSLSYKNDFLHLPLINIWLEDFRKLLAERDSSFTPSYSSFTFLPTYDIDIAWSYRNKGTWRNIGGALRSMGSGEWLTGKEQLNVLLNKQKDPYDVYDWLDSLHIRYKLEPHYFFLVAQKRGRYDKNISSRKKEYQQLIQQHTKKYKIGIHPSWQSGDNPPLLQQEIRIIENSINQKITSSRQHYIRLTIPQTYRRLISAGITDDYSMGYGSINGFRASVATPFYWYDLEKEEQTTLRLHPFCYMDATSFFEQKYTPQQALQEILNYYHTVKGVNGMLITIWHNPFLGSNPLFKGWKEVYESFIRTVCSSLPL